MALWQRCVHLGCRVPSACSSQGFECPCHGSKYNFHGEYEDGPAPRNMDRFAVESTTTVTSSSRPASRRDLPGHAQDHCLPAGTVVPVTAALSLILASRSATAHPPAPANVGLGALVLIVVDRRLPHLGRATSSSTAAGRQEEGRRDPAQPAALSVRRRVGEQPAHPDPHGCGRRRRRPGSLCRCTTSSSQTARPSGEAQKRARTSKRATSGTPSFECVDCHGPTVGAARPIRRGAQRARDLVGGSLPQRCLLPLRRGRRRVLDRLRPRRHPDARPTVSRVAAP